MDNLYALVIIGSSHNDVDKIFDYAVPKKYHSVICRGMRVEVPFGYRNKKTEGYVIDLKGSTSISSEKIKSILEVLDEKPVFSDELLELALWMKDKYFTSLNKCIASIIPSGIGIKSRWIVKILENTDLSSLNAKENEIFSYIDNNGGAVLEDLIKLNFGNNKNSLISMKSKGAIAYEQSSKRSKYEMTKQLLSLTKDKQRVEKIKDLYSGNKKFIQRINLIELLEEKKEMDVKEIKDILKISDSPIKSLIESEIINVQVKNIKRDVVSIEKYEKTDPFILSNEQKNAYDMIEQNRNSSGKKPVLIYGVTGSGKTEIYLQLIDKLISEGKEAIVLVPEISLTPQIVGRFISRFGDRVSVTHSRLSQGERYDQWKKARDGEVSVMIGPRSAVFTPFKNLGLIIVDEEHETSYKSESTPKYDAREVAQKRCEIIGAQLVLSSATPSFNTYLKTKEKVFDIAVLKSRARDSELPTLKIVDMRNELSQGNTSIFSEELYNEIINTLNRKQQVMLFLNRRGFSSFVSCRSCGHVMTCDNCSVSYTYHSKNDSLMCHYCGKKTNNPKECPVCGSKYIKYFGTGTQKVESEVRKLFPSAKVLRMDIDTTTKKHSHEKILRAFGDGDADILIGTQMIAKGHDFPNVTLVGIIAADISLHTGDYKAAETTFQLITQMAGRAGRGQKKGNVVIQTYSPDNYSIVYATNHDFEGFYEEGIKIRKTLEYPPFSNIFTILVTGKSEKSVIDGSHILKDIMNYYSKNKDFIILGPTPAFVSKVKNEYRWRLIVKCNDEQRLKNFVLYCIEKFENHGKIGDIMLNLSMNPQIII